MNYFRGHNAGLMQVAAHSRRKPHMPRGIRKPRPQWDASKPFFLPDTTARKHWSCRCGLHFTRVVGVRLALTGKGIVRDRKCSCGKVWYSVS